MQICRFLPQIDSPKIKKVTYLQPTDDPIIGNLQSNGSNCERNPDESNLTLQASLTFLVEETGGGREIGTTLDTSGRSLEYRRTDACDGVKPDTSAT